MKLLKGKCKKDFEKYYLKKYHGSIKNKTTLKLQLLVWYSLPLSKKIGVLVDFFESVGIVIDIYPVFNYDHEKYTNVIEYLVSVRKLNEIDDDEEPIEFKTRQEAREYSIKQANEIHNQWKERHGKKPKMKE